MTDRLLLLAANCSPYCELRESKTSLFGYVSSSGMHAVTQTVTVDDGTHFPFGCGTAVGEQCPGHTRTAAEADLGMCSMFGRAGTPQKGAPTVGHGPKITVLLRNIQ